MSQASQEKEKKKKEKKRCSQKFIKEGVQSRLSNEKGNKEKVHDTKSVWKMTLIDYNIWLMIFI